MTYVPLQWIIWWFVADYMLHQHAIVLCRPIGWPAKCCTKRCLEFENNVVGHMTFLVEANMTARLLLCLYVCEPVWLFDNTSRSCLNDFIYLCWITSCGYVYCSFFMHIFCIFMVSVYVCLFLATFDVVLLLILMRWPGCGSHPWSGI